MATVLPSRLNEHFRATRAASRAKLEGATDARLMDLFIDHHDDSAFAELVRRHGSMVLGVCRRVLHNAHDAEDCFQAAFLVLVKKATTIEPRGMVGNWLYGVAYRTALEARKLAARRRNMERKKPAPTPADEPSELWQQLGPMLDQELARLPDKHRAVLIACDIEGKTRQEAAHELGLPEGTVASRLARARAMLARRMAKYSLNMSTPALVALMASKGAPPIPPALLAATVYAGSELAAGEPAADVVSPRVAALTEQMSRESWFGRVQAASAILIVLISLGVGIGTMLTGTAAEKATIAKPNAFKAVDKTIIARDCILQHVDLANRTIHASEYNDSTLHDVRIEPETRIRIDGRDSTLADIKPGAAIDLEWRRGADGANHAVRIEATGHYLMGVVQAITDEKVTIEIDNAKKTYEVEKGAWVIINGKKTKLTDLKAKMKVTFKVSADRIQGIDAASKVKGAVKAIDVKKQTVCIESEQPDVAANAITVAHDAPIFIDGRKAKLADLAPGTAVTVRFTTEVEPAAILAIVTLPRAKKE